MKDIIISLFCASIITIIALFGTIQTYDTKYAGKTYPAVTIGGVSFGNQTPQEVTSYWLAKNEPFSHAIFTFTFENHIATLSGNDLSLGFDATLSAQQAYSVGRSGNFLSDILIKFFTKSVELTPYFHWNEDVFDEFINNVSSSIAIPPQEAQFQFIDGKVTEFNPSKEGREVNIQETKQRFQETLTILPYNSDTSMSIPLSVHVLKPSITTEAVNNFGIKELIGTGYSEFKHSIPGRIHNVALAAAKINGILIKPGDIFSFNEALGDISQATGFQPAYIIKDGRTVLGDGGGVCQVSTTLFRAALNAGLPIVTRTAHAYRVQYYEQAGYKAGLDATVFAPSVDLKFKNDTASYILIQTTTDTINQKLTFTLYGTKDGRYAEIRNHQVGGIVAPPPELYQDDPTLPVGVVKQVDFAAWGAKASFEYRVTRGNEVIFEKNFTSTYRPWQAVFLRGTATL